MDIINDPRVVQLLDILQSRYDEDETHFDIIMDALIEDV